ncbi:MAG: hypothetical protein NZ908_02595 [Candidatus Micrarchaeota archaeon]|nr:hypothetical protein [Candidatus Micrarchaeota archaeon]MCX8154574.1 hypothetical protein [Candidatus Micrarchaeota archaeon]
MIIYWDLDGTLRKNAELSYNAILNTITRFFPNLKIYTDDPDELYVKWNIVTFLSAQSDRNVFREFFIEITRGQEVDDTVLDRAAAFAKSYVHSKIEMEPPFEHTEAALSIISHLRNGIISHAKSGSTVGWLRRYGLDKYFDMNLIFDGVKRKEDYMLGKFIYVGDSIVDLYSFLISISRGNDGIIYLIRPERYEPYLSELIQRFSRNIDVKSRIRSVRDSLDAAQRIVRENNF